MLRGWVGTRERGVHERNNTWKEGKKRGERVSEDFWKVTQRGEMMRKKYIKMREEMTDKKREVKMEKGERVKNRDNGWRDGKYL